MRARQEKQMYFERMRGVLKDGDGGRQCYRLPYSRIQRRQRSMAQISAKLKASKDDKERW
jgi:hypothetical protein